MSGLCSVLWARVVATALLLASGAAALAQAPQPPPPSAPATSSLYEPWRFALSASGSWYENASFVGAAAEDTAWSTEGRGTLSYDKRFRTGTVSFAGFGGAIYYPEIDDFNQPTYGGSIDLKWDPSRRTTFRLGQRYERTSTRYLSGVDAEGLPLPTSTMDFATSSLGLERQLSQSWQLALDGSFQLRRYDDELLQDGEQVFASARLGHQAGRNGQLYLAYAFTSAWLEDDHLRTHEALFGGRRQIERGLSFELAGGVGYMESTGDIYPTGRAGLFAQGRRTRLSVVYYRSFGQAYGYGRQMIGDIASATVSWTAGRRVTFDASYNFGYRRDPADEEYTVVSSVASAGFRWQVGGGVDFDAHYSWERNETEGLSVVEGGRATATLTYGVGWR